ncbi:hypothetical protein [Caldimonas tepidiphila]|uniref:hypothetical protein n=1 Tax=Caldimonas tepidiphila TaxID=2315841 RepID=UPI000E5C4155|nr:hypothetical protein [Caldimonas tepidiphila]
MAFKLVVSNTVAVPVKGVISDEAGKSVPFNFSLTCERLTAAELKSVIDSKETLVGEVVQRVAQGWSGVLDAEGQPLPYSDAGLAQLLDIPGIASLCFGAYIQAVGAKEKN